MTREEAVSSQQSAVRQASFGSGARIASALIIVGMLLMSVSCAKKDGPKPEERATIKKIDLRDVMTQTGDVRPIVKIELKSEASGRINRIYVKEGQSIKRGDTILTIDPLRLRYQRDKTELAVRQSEIQRDRTRRDLEQSKALELTGSVSVKQIADQQSDLELKEISCKQQQLELKDILDQLDKTVVIAPMSGVLTNLNVEEGEIAVSATSGFQAGTSIGTIANVSKLEVVSKIGEVDYVHLKLGRKVNILPQAFENTRAPGTITFISQSAKRNANEELGNFEVRVSVDSLIPGIAPGINVNIEFVLTEKKDVLGVPNRFVVRKGQFYSVNLVKKDAGGKESSERAKIEVGMTDYQNYEILSGLKQGDVVSFKLPDGDKKNAPARGPGGGPRH